MKPFRVHIRSSYLVYRIAFKGPPPVAVALGPPTVAVALGPPPVAVALGLPPVAALRQWPGALHWWLQLKLVFANI